MNSKICFRILHIFWDNFFFIYGRLKKLKIIHKIKKNWEIDFSYVSEHRMLYWTKK